ncbi:MAG: PTS sugar transporter subunit IIA [Clostridium sp.]|nr:PTS sugar transporter subunit IIA [Clostridium sp.]
MGKVAVIISSHGPMAKAVMESAEMVIGKQENACAVCVDMDMNLDEIIEQMEAAYQKLNTENGAVVLVDILGGTPGNAGGVLALKHENVLVYSGLNFPLIIQLFFNQEAAIEELGELLERAYLEGIHNISKKVRESEAKEDECEI